MPGPGPYHGAVDRCLHGQALWSQSYEGDLRDTLALQDRVARAIAEQIKISLTPREQAELKSVRVVNPEAYESYLKGRSSGMAERQMV